MNSSFSAGAATTIGFTINEAPLPSFYLYLANQSCVGYEPTPTPSVSPTPAPEEEYLLSGVLLDAKGRRITGRFASRINTLLAQNKLRIVVTDFAGNDILDAVPFFESGRLVWSATAPEGIYNIKVVGGVRVVSKPSRLRVILNSRTVKLVPVPGSAPEGEELSQAKGRSGLSFAVR